MMRNPRTILIVLAILSLPLHAAEPDPDVLAVREEAWRAWFRGDEASLRAILPEEFQGIGWGGTKIADRETTIADSRGFKEAGGKLVALSFPETHMQRLGDTAIFYGSFDVTLAIGGKEERVRGRLTEVFVKRDGKWLHPGWHLDQRQ